MIAVLLLASAPGEASAKKRIVVLDFGGARSAKFQAAITKIIKKKHSVITSRRYKASARKLRATKPNARNVSRVAHDISADGVLIGSVRRQGSRYLVTIRIRAGADGEFATKFAVRTRRPSLRGATLRKVQSRLLREINDLPPLGDVEEVGDDDDDDIVEFEEPGGDDDDDDGRAKKRGGDDDDDGDDDDGGGGEVKKDAKINVSPERLADLEARGRGLDVMGGLSFMGRNLSFTVRSGLGDLAPRGYQGNPVAGAYVVGELYPMAFNLENSSITRDIGLTAVVDRVLKINSKLVYEDAMMMQQIVDLPTEQMRWGVGAVFRYNFGNSPTKPTIKLSVRYNRAKFIIDKDAAPMGVPVDIPNMDYVYIDPGAAIRYPVSPKIALMADVRFLLITDTGEMQQTDQYGGATVTGIDVDAGAEYKIDKRLFIRVGGRFMQIGYTFDGSGDLASLRDMDGNTQDVFGASDRYVGGYATAGYLF